MAAVALAPPPVLQFFSNLGLVNAGGSLLTQIGGINAATYQDAAGTIPLPNPIPLNSRGEISNAAGISSQLFLVQGSTYSFILYDAAGNQIGTFSNVIALAASALTVGYTPPVTGPAATTVSIELGRQYPVVMDWAGVDPAGVTDSTTGIQAALNDAIFVNGGVLRFPGKFKVSSTLTCTKPILLLGQGPGEFSLPATTPASQLVWAGG